MSDRQAGYTLVEMLAALAVVGLAFASLSQAMLSVSRLGRAAASARDASAYRHQLSTALGEALADASKLQAVQGDGSHASWPCTPRPCSAQFAGNSLILEGPYGKTELNGADRLQFLYVGEDGVSSSWPPVEPATLVALLVAAKPANLASPIAIVAIAVDAEQPLRCDYDSISMRCRTD